MQRVSAAVLILALGALSPALAGRTITAASCSHADVQTALNQHLASPQDGDIISIPAGNCTWTATLRATLTHTITIQGAGAISATDGGSGTTGSDITTILDRHPTTGHNLFDFKVASGKHLRITGIKIAMDGSSTTTQGGVIAVSGGSNSLRIDHCHFVINADSSMTIAVYNGVTGVIDHNYFDSAVGNGPFAVYLQNGVGTGDAAWNDPDDFGTDKFLFIEDNRWRNGYLGDANTGGQRFVYRYNTAVMQAGDSTPTIGYVANHGITPGRNRSSRAFEYYGNNISAPSPGLNKSPFPINGGTGLVWGNTISQYRYVTSLDYTRKSSATYSYASPPSSWGYCNGSAGTVWDAPERYPCLDQPGRGRGDLLSGSFPNVINTRTGNASYVRQALSPVYVWGNTLNPAGYSPIYITNVGASAIIQANRDYYQQFGPNGESGSFDGTRGVGQGLLSARPVTCTAGPGGNTPGVGYWATDLKTLYVCTATNTWSAYYTPYTYPHPLQSGGTPTPTPTDTTPPSTPTTLTAAAISASGINLSWTASTDNVGVTGYRVERCQGASCSNFTQIATPFSNAYSDAGLAASSAYTYRVRAADAAGNLSSYSSNATATTQAAAADTTPPSTPSTLTAAAISSSGISLSWTASTDNVGVTGYRVERCQGASCSNFAQIAAPVSNSYSDFGLADSTTYRYRVRASDANGNVSSYSSIASATTQVASGAPPPLPTGNSGIAAMFPNDANINSHPDVLFADGFETYTSSSQLTSSGNFNNYYNDTAMDTSVFFSGTKSLRLRIPQISTGYGSGVEKLIAAKDTLFMRVYQRFQPTYAGVVESHSGFEISGNYPGPGIKPNGSDFFLVLLENSRYLSEAEPGYTHAYVYHPEQDDVYGEHWYSDGFVSNGKQDFGQFFIPRPNVIPTRGQWISYEMMVKLNTPGQRDGRVAVWQDGNLIADWQNLRFRDTSTVKISKITMGNGGKSSSQQNDKWYDNLVLANSYIGPMSTDSQVPMPPTNVVTAIR